MTSSRRSNDAQVAAGNEALKDYNYAAETYDAIVIIALAAEKAKTDAHRVRQGDQRDHPRWREVR
ncbi:MAG: hypothetical protein R2749_04300 [Acidimicrobiales bacterium]